MKTAAVYIRVSTDDQTEYSPDAQLREVKKYAAAHGLTIDEKHIYIDDGISGRKTKKRTAFNKMIGIAKAEPKPFDVILLWKSSRFARNRVDSVIYKAMLRQQLGIDVISITEDFGNGKMSMLFEAQIEAWDEFYSINLAEDVKNGMTEKANRGEFQTAPPLGYSKLPGQPLQVVEDEAKYIRSIFDQYLGGMSFFAIAGKLNAMGFRTRRGNKIESRTVEYILNNPVYKGYVRWTPSGKTVSSRIYDSPDTIVRRSDHEPIIPEELFDKASGRLAAARERKASRSRPAETKKHYLSGILKCSGCGSTLAYAGSSGGFQCIKYAHGTCKPSHYIQADKIEPAILAELDRISLPGVYTESGPDPSSHAEERALIRKELDAMEKMFDRARLAYLSGIDTLEEYESNKTRIQAEIEEKAAELAKITAPAAEPKPKEVKAELEKTRATKTKTMNVKSFLVSDAPTAKKNAALGEIVEKITFSRPDDCIEIFLYG